MSDLRVIREAYDAFNRRDADALAAISDPEIEIEPLVAALTAPGPWHGHDGVRRVVADAEAGWSHFRLRPDELVEVGDRIVAFVHIETSARDGGPVVSGDIAHVIELRDGLVVSFRAMRDREAALHDAT